MVFRDLKPTRMLERLIDQPASALFLLWLFMVLAFALVFFVLSGIPGSGLEGAVTDAASLSRFLDALYFSIITAVTVGYGDLTPLGWSRPFAAMEGILGFFLFAVLISKFVSQKQETALSHVHKLSFQNAFFTTREGFFILRRDCDAIVAEAHADGALDEKSWANLFIVFQKGQALLEGILDFYHDLDWYTIDERREKLLLESVDRTVERVVTLLRALDAAEIPWRKHPEISGELRDFGALVAVVARQWQKRSRYEHREWFAKITRDSEKLAAAFSA